MSKKNEQVKSSNFNLQVINPEELKNHLTILLQNERAVFVLGQRGSGKTVIAKDTIKEAGYKEVYLNLSMLERVDLAGYPQILGNTGGYVSYLLPQYFKDLIEGDQKCVLILDEVDKVDSSLNAPLLELTQFHTINGTKLKNLQGIIMTANFVEEGGSKPISPLLDRSVKFILENNADMWLRWGGENNIHPSISTFIKEKPHHLQAVSTDSDYANASPRGWEYASNLIHAGIKNNIDEKTIFQMVCGQVGSKIASEYEMFYKYFLKLIPILDQLFDTPEKDLESKTNIKWHADYDGLNKTENLMFAFSVANRFYTRIKSIQENLENANASDKEKFEKEEKALVSTFINFFSKYCEQEVCVISIRTQIPKPFFNEVMFTTIGNKKQSAAIKKFKDFVKKVYEERK